MHAYVINIYRPIYTHAQVHAEYMHIYYVHAPIYMNVYI